jgi:hypothetical protein
MQEGHKLIRDEEETSLSEEYVEDHSDAALGNRIQRILNRIRNKK